MPTFTHSVLNRLQNTATFLKAHKLHCAALLLIAIWCLPYITTGNRIEWGDFGIFAQGYEAIRISVLQYHQFPWWNAWLVGGAPLYANPQLGVFSLQTILVFLFGASVGLKYAYIIYTFAGYFSMLLLLRKYYRVPSKASILLSLIWVFSSFFVDHFPSHFTFVWYIMSPLYVYLSLTVRNIRSGAWLGLAFAIMALSQVHNAFFQIGLVCGLIIIIRLIRNRSIRLEMVKGLAVATGLFLLLAGHRLIYAVQNVQDFPRLVSDEAPAVINSALAIVLPFSNAHSLYFISYPFAPFGWGEATATIGIVATLAFIICALFLVYTVRLRPKVLSPIAKQSLTILGIGALFFIIGCGLFSPYAPYNLLKHIPIFGNLRVSSRWFLGLNMTMLIFIGLIIRTAGKKTFFNFLAHALLMVGVLELFILNVGYQNNVLSHSIITPKKSAIQYAFTQTYHFGETPNLPGGERLPNDGTLGHYYREYEGTMFNTGVLQANDALIDLNTKPTPRCSWNYGCNFVMTSNARVSYWSPNKIVLKRLAPGPIELNMNASNYLLVNGVRDTSIRVAEPYKNFFVTDKSPTITIKVTPSLTEAL